MKTVKENPNLKHPPEWPTPKGASLVLKGHPIDLSRTRLMGILNVTPDSFSDGGYYLDPEKALTHLYQLLT